MAVGQTKTKKKWIYQGDTLDVMGTYSPKGKGTGGSAYGGTGVKPNPGYGGYGAPTTADLYRKKPTTPAAPATGAQGAGAGVLAPRYLPKTVSPLPPVGGKTPLPGRPIMGKSASMGELRRIEGRRSKISARPATGAYGAGAGVLSRQYNPSGGYGDDIFPKLPTGSSMPGTPIMGRGAGLGALRRFEGGVNAPAAGYGGGTGMGALRVFESANRAQPAPPAKTAPSVAAKVAPKAAPSVGTGSKVQAPKGNLVESFKKRYPEAAAKAGRVFGTPAGRSGKISAKPKTTKITARTGVSPKGGGKITAKPSGVTGKAKSWWDSLSPGWKTGIKYGAAALGGYALARLTEDDDGDYYGGGNAYYTRNYYYGGGGRGRGGRSGRRF